MLSHQVMQLSHRVMWLLQAASWVWIQDRVWLPQCSLLSWLPIPLMQLLVQQQPKHAMLECQGLSAEEINR
jgi:hypothetical protein